MMKGVFSLTFILLVLNVLNHCLSFIKLFGHSLKPVKFAPFKIIDSFS